MRTFWQRWRAWERLKTDKQGDHICILQAHVSTFEPLGLRLPRQACVLEMMSWYLLSSVYELLEALQCTDLFLLCPSSIVISCDLQLNSMTADHFWGKLPSHEEHSCCKVLHQCWAKAKVLGTQQGPCVQDITHVMHRHDDSSQHEYAAESADKEPASSHQPWWLQ